MKAFRYLRETEPNFFPVKSEMSCFSLSNCDFIRSREPGFFKIILREMTKKYFKIRGGPW